MTEKVALPPDFAVHDAVADGARSEARSKRSPTSCSRPSTRCCWPNMPAGARTASTTSSTLAETTGAGGVGRQQRAQLPEQASALPQHGQGRRSSTPTWCSASTSRIGRSSSPSSTARRGSSNRWSPRTATMSRSASPRSTSANGRWTIAACSRARCARSATPRSASRSSRASARSASQRTPASRRRSRTARSRSASATTRSGPSGSRTPRRTGTPPRSPSSGSRWKCGR